MVIVSDTRASIHCWSSTAGPSDETTPRSATRDRRCPTTARGTAPAGNLLPPDTARHRETPWRTCIRHTCRDPACVSGARPSHRDRTLPIPLSTIPGMLTPSERQCKPDREGSRSRTAKPAGRGAHPHGTHTPQPPVRVRYRRRVREPNTLTTGSAPERPSRLGPDDRRDHAGAGRSYTFPITKSF